jgi:hypothetical protein
MSHTEGLAVTTALTAALSSVVLAVLVGVFASSRPTPAVDAACQEWTDGCVICARTTTGLACSTPGIACVTGPVQCLRP